MNFIKTQSSIYSSFHKTTRTVNFEVGYSKAKWLATLNDKWSEYSNFYVAGFLEDIYSINSTDSGTEIAYAQIDARIVDYDPRFRQSKTSTSSTSPTTSPKSTNTFAKRRLTASTTTASTTTASTTTKSPTTKSPTTKSQTTISQSPTTPIVSTTPPPNDDNQLSDNDSVHSIQSIPSDPELPDSASTHVITPVNQTRQTKKRRQLSNLCDTDEDPIDNDPIPPPPPKPKRVYKKRSGR
jgi:hypothetical protein